MPTALHNLTDETRDELASLALKLSGNQKTRKGFLGLIKEASPSTPIPEIDEVEAVNAEIAKRDVKIEALEKKVQDDIFSRNLAATKADVRERYGLEAAQVAAGHAKADTTQIYATRDEALAQKVAREMG